MGKRLTITMNGEFTAFELASLVTFIRGLDRDERHWQIFIDDPEGTTLKEAEQILKDAMPPLPGRTTPTFEVYRKQ